MTPLIAGLDSAYAPSLQQAQAAKAAGYHWWGFYIQGVGNTDPLHAWTPGEEQVLIQAGVKPVPICIPSPVAVADPVQCATQAFNSCKNYGLNPLVSICYNGEHIPVLGPVWLPIPGSTPSSVGPQSAIQWGGGNIAGTNVDLNLAAVDFPMDTGIACDLEHDAGYTPAWYILFQNTIAHLAKGNPTPMPTNLTPQDVQNIVNGVQVMMRWEFAPGDPTKNQPEGELYGRIREAVAAADNT